MKDGRGTTRAEDAQGTPTQSQISPRILVYEDYTTQAPAAVLAPEQYRSFAHNLSNIQSQLFLATTVTTHPDHTTAPVW